MDISIRLLERGGVSRKLINAYKRSGAPITCKIYNENNKHIFEPEVKDHSWLDDDKLIVNSEHKATKLNWIKGSEIFINNISIGKGDFPDIVGISNGDTLRIKHQLEIKYDHL